MFKKEKNLRRITVISSQKVGKCSVLRQLCSKIQRSMQRKTNTFGGESHPVGYIKGEIPYYVDNLFYESFGMSSDEFFEAMRKSDFFELV